MGLGDIINKTFKDYGNNWKSYSLATIILYGLPFIIFNAAIIYYSINTGFYQSVLDFQTNGIDNVFDVLNLFIPFVIMFFVYMLVSSLIYIILARGIISVGGKERSSFGELFSLGTKKYGLTLGFYILYFLFLIGLFFLFIIPGIIFSIYWVLAIYVLIYENKGVIDSLKGSYNLVRNRWWRTLGYVIVFVFISWAISGLISIPSAIFGGYTQAQMLIGGISNEIIIITSIVDMLTTVISNCILLPLGLLFGRNMYLEYKRKK